MKNCFFLHSYYQSGMSKHAFCRAHGICCPALLNSWIKKYSNLAEELSLPSEQESPDMSNRSKEAYKDENAQLKKRIKELEKALSFSKLETEARELMITRAEELFNIPIRKKIWGQIVTELVSQRNLKVALACRLFGHCRQAYYQSKADIESQIHRERLMLDAVRDIRIEDPGIGCYKLWIMLTVLFWSRVHAWAGQLLCIAPATPLDASCPQDPAYDELQPSLPQVEEPNQRTDLDFSQPVVGQRHYLYTTCQW